MKKLLGNILPAKITKKEASDTGMAMVLICLLLGYFTGKQIYFLSAIPVLVLNMAIPLAFYPIAYIWLAITNLMGAIVSKAVLTVVYMLILLPTALVRRLMGKDTLNIKGFKKGTETAMITRNHEFKASDIKSPF